MFRDQLFAPETRIYVLHFHFQFQCVSVTHCVCLGKIALVKLQLYLNKIVLMPTCMNVCCSQGSVFCAIKTVFAVFFSSKIRMRNICKRDTRAIVFLSGFYVFCLSRWNVAKNWICRAQWHTYIGHIGLLQDTIGGDTRNLWIHLSHFSSELHRPSLDVDVPIVLLDNLNRGRRWNRWFIVDYCGKTEADVMQFDGWLNVGEK